MHKVKVNSQSQVIQASSTMEHSLTTSKMVKERKYGTMVELIIKDSSKMERRDQRDS